MKGVSRLTVRLLLVATILGCSNDHPAKNPQVARRGEAATAVPPGASTNSYYLLGLAQGRKHIPQTSWIVIPPESTNWSAESKSLYRLGYLEGMRTK